MTYDHVTDEWSPKKRYFRILVISSESSTDTDLQEITWEMNHPNYTSIQINRYFRSNDPLWNLTKNDIWHGLFLIQLCGTTSIASIECVSIGLERRIILEMSYCKESLIELLRLFWENLLRWTIWEKRHKRRIIVSRILLIYLKNFEKMFYCRISIECHIIDEAL